MNTQFAKITLFTLDNSLICNEIQGKKHNSLLKIEINFFQ